MPVYTHKVYTNKSNNKNTRKMTDMFDEMIWCKECRTEMKKVLVNKDGFQLRALQCIKCGKRIYHPNDVEEFKRNLRVMWKSQDVVFEESQKVEESYNAGNFLIKWLHN